MSKKNKKAEKDEPINLANLKVAVSVVIQLPPEITIVQQIQPLLEGYLRQKLNNKKIRPGQSFIALFKGKEQTFFIRTIDGLNFSEKQEAEKKESEQLKEPKQGQSSQFIVNNTTEIKLVNYIPPSSKQTKQYESYFFGYESQLRDLEQSIKHSLFQRQQLIKNGLGPLKGILISGYSGTGKTALLKATQNKLNNQHSSIHWKNISSVQLLSRVVGGAQEFIRGIFSDLKKSTPAVLSIEDVHLLFGVKEVSSHETALAALLSEMEKAEWQQVVVVATYNSQRQLAKSIRSADKFQKQIVMNLPNHSVRLQILSKMIERLNLVKPIDAQQLKRINLRLNGFSVGEIKQILRQVYNKHGTQLTFDDLDQMLKKYRPAQIKELIVEVPEVYWKEIGGYQSVKKQIRKVVELPLQHASKFMKFGIEPSKGIMLYGPPGCSKTMMAKAIATESKLNFIGIKGPELFSKYVGESEAAIRNIFKRARACSPCVIFFDEIDAIATQRSGNTEVSERVLCQLLNEMDGIEGLKEVAIVAATNRPQILDKALMRPGRFDYLIYVSPPDEQARTQIFRIYLQKSVKQDQVQELSGAMAKKTEHYTGAEISLICREAVMLALEEDLECQHILLSHLEGALKRVKRRLTWDIIAKYQQFSSSLRE